MDIFDKIGKTANKTYKYTAEKTTKIAREAKLKMQIAENKAKIDDLYEEIGKKVYEKHIREEKIDIKEDLQQECSKIDEITKTITDARKEILSLKDRKQCEKCASEIDICFKYCPQCGKKQKDEPIREVEILDNLENADIPKEKEDESSIIEDVLKEDIKKNNDE